MLQKVCTIKTTVLTILAQSGVSNQTKPANIAILNAKQIYFVLDAEKKLLYGR